MDVNVMQHQTRRWCKPPEGWIKINIYDVYQDQTGKIWIACIIRDDHGDFLRARSNRHRGKRQVREAEALGLQEAIRWVMQWRNYKCIFEMDSKLVVDAIHGGGGNSIIDDCIPLLKHFIEVLVVFEYRSANSVAHLLARAAHELRFPCQVQWSDVILLLKLSVVILLLMQFK